SGAGRLSPTLPQHRVSWPEPVSVPRPRGESDGEMCDALVEAAQQLTNIRLDDRPFVVFPSESLHRLDRVPGCGDDDFTFVPALSGHHLDLDKAIDRAETGEDRIRKMLAAVLL